MMVAWVLGCILTATLLVALLLVGPINIPARGVLLKGTQSQAPHKLLAKISDWQVYLPSVALLLGIGAGFCFSQRFPHPAPWVGWLFLLLAIPPLFFFLMLLVFSGEVAWAQSWEDLNTAIFFFLPLMMAIGYVASGLALLTGVAPRTQAWVFGMTVAVLASGVGIGKLRDLLFRWSAPKMPGSAVYQVSVDPPANEDEQSRQQAVEQLPWPSPKVNAGRFSLDNRYLCYASYWNLRTYLWEVETGRRHTLPAGANFRAEWAPETNFLAAATGLNKITVFAPPNWQPIAVIQDAEIFCWHPSGKRLAYRNRGDEVFVQEIGGAEGVRRIQFPTPIVGGGEMAWSADGSQLVVVGAQAGTYVLAESTGRISLTPQLEKRGGAMSGLAVSPTGEEFALQAYKAGYQAGLVALYGKGGSHLEQRIRLQTGTEGGGGMHWSPKGTYLAIRERLLNTEQINLYRLHPFKKITSLRSERRESWKDVLWTEDERSLYALRGDGVVWRWDLSALRD